MKITEKFLSHKFLYKGLIILSTHVNEILLESLAQIIDERGLAEKIFQENKVLDANSVPFMQPTLHIFEQFPVGFENFRSRGIRLTQATPSVDCVHAANISQDQNCSLLSIFTRPFIYQSILRNFVICNNGTF